MYNKTEAGLLVPRTVCMWRHLFVMPVNLSLHCGQWCLRHSDVMGRQTAIQIPHYSPCRTTLCFSRRDSHQYQLHTILFLLKIKNQYKWPPWCLLGLCYMSFRVDVCCSGRILKSATFISVFLFMFPCASHGNMNVQHKVVWSAFMNHWHVIWGWLKIVTCIEQIKTWEYTRTCSFTSLGVSHYVPGISHTLWNVTSNWSLLTHHYTLFSLHPTPPHPIHLWVEGASESGNSVRTLVLPAVTPYHYITFVVQMRSAMWLETLFLTRLAASVTSCKHVAPIWTDDV